MKEAGYVLGNLDATIIAQKPKLSPHKVSSPGRAVCTSSRPVGTDVPTWNGSCGRLRWLLPLGPSDKCT